MTLRDSRDNHEINQRWFEMASFRHRNYNDGTVWIPLRASEEIEKIGKQGEDGYISDYFGLGSLALPLGARAKGENLNWGDVGIGHSHSSYVRDDGSYSAAEQYDNGFESIGLRLVIEQYIEGDGYFEWHVHHDLVIALGLRREIDKWVDPARGYVEVLKLNRNSEGKPCRIEMRAQYLKDYLAARKLALKISLYRGRISILSSRDCVDWANSHVIDDQPNDRWEGRIDAIHEGGMPFGSKMAIFHAGRTDVDDEVDVPKFDMSEGITSDSWTKTFDGRKLYRIQGELWKDEWVEPAATSQIVAGEVPAPITPFIVNEKGDRETAQTLVRGVRWLWFKPEVVPALLQYRGGSLGWYTRFTGGVGCSPLYGVHFGINPLGLVNVFAKDIGQLPEWQQQIWAAFNVSPEGGVSGELLASQNRADPARTEAPEAYLELAMGRLDDLASAKLGFRLFQEHAYVAELFPKVHRFRALTEDGLRALAKDLARLVVDRIDAAAMQGIVSPPKGEKWGGLKSLERFLATNLKDEVAHKMVGPLHGVYQLRHTDAHLPPGDVSEAKTLARIDTTKPYVHQGFEILDTCVTCLWIIGDVLDERF